MSTIRKVCNFHCGAVFWVMELCNVISGCQEFGRTYCCLLQNKNKEADNIFFQNYDTNFSGNNVSISAMIIQDIYHGL